MKSARGDEAEKGIAGADGTRRAADRTRRSADWTKKLQLDMGPVNL